MAKTLDPIWRSERGNQPEAWASLFDALDRALKLHLIVCPESRIHEQESVVHPHFEVLQRLYEHFAAETSFDFPTQIQAVQLQVALEAKLAGQSPDFTAITPDRVISGSLATWMERISIRVNGPAALTDPSTVRSSRDRSGAAFAAIFERWAQEKPTFEEVYSAERLGLAEAMIQLLRDYVRLQHRVALGQTEPSEDLWNYRLEVGVALGLIRTAEGSGMSYEDAFRFATDFLFSEEALSAPMNEISSLLMAGLASRAAMGQKRLPSRGMWNDMTAISAFLPYCDAMFVDNECAQLLGERPISERLSYSTRVFSTRTLQPFITYLENLEAEAGLEWVQLIERIYGHEWLVPFRTILDQTRERNARRAETAARA